MIRPTFTAKICPADRPNRNMRLYSTEILKKAIEQVQPRIEAQTFHGEFGFPVQGMGQDQESFEHRIMQVDEAKASHQIDNLRLEDGWLVGDITILDTPYGRLLDETMINEQIDFRFRCFTTYDGRRNGVYHIETCNLVSIDACRDGA
jgi:hypothetical protein